MSRVAVRGAAAPVTERSALPRRGATSVAPAGRPGALRSTRFTRLVVALPLVFVSVAVLDYAFALVRPGTRQQVWLYWTIIWATPIWLPGLLLLVAFPVVLVVGRRCALRAAPVDLLLTAVFACYCFSTRIAPPTGDQVGWWKGAATPSVAASEALAEVVHKIPFWFTHDLDSVRLIPPVFGVLTMAAYLVLARRISLQTGADRDLLRLFAIASPLPFWFVAGYIENTFLALPFLFLAVERLLAHLADGQVAALTASAGLAGLAVATHLFMLVALAAMVLAALLRPGASGAARVRGASVLLLGSATVTAAVIGAIALTPLQLHPGNTNGGFDHQLLTPWVLHAGEWPNRFTMVSHAHLIEVSNIVVHTAPALVLAFPLLVGVLRRRAATAVLEPSPAIVLLALLGLADLAFVAVFGFDYGPVGDLDLMLVLAVPLGLLLLLVTSRLLERRPALLWGLVLGSAVANLAFYTLKVGTAWTA